MTEKLEELKLRLADSEKLRSDLDKQNQELRLARARLDEHIRAHQLVLGNAKRHVHVNNLALARKRNRVATWVQLEVRDNWGLPEYFLAGEGLDESETISNEHIDLKLGVGRAFGVRLADGSVGTRALATQRTSVQLPRENRLIADYASVNLFGFDVEHHGTTSFAPIETVEIRRATQVTSIEQRT